MLVQKSNVREDVKTFRNRHILLLCTDNEHDLLGVQGFNEGISAEARRHTCIGVRCGVHNDRNASVAEVVVVVADKVVLLEERTKTIETLGVAEDFQVGLLGRTSLR